MKKTRYAVIGALLALGCSTQMTPGDAGTSEDASPTDGGSISPDAAPDDASSSDAAVAGTVTVRTDVSLGGHPHAIDLYVPSSAERVIVFLHGGGGSKEGGAARETGVRLDDPPAASPVPDEAWLLATRTAWVFPQGQHLPSAQRASTWSNYVMTSGVDDVAFLGDLAAALRAGTLDPALPAMSRVYLAGHSNGGMMAAREWCESTATFDGYGALAGPPSVELLPMGAHPCAPSAARPYLAVIGSADTIVQTANGWSSPWGINSCLSSGSGGAVVMPALANEEPFHAFRAAQICGGTGGVPTSTAETTTWADCGDHARLVRVEGAEHCVMSGTMPCQDNRLLGGSCTSSLDARSGTRMRDVLVAFFVGTE